jgi:hypothetical protein
MQRSEYPGNPVVARQNQSVALAVGQVYELELALQGYDCIV